MKKIILLLCLSTVLLHAETKKHKFFRISLAVLVSANAADTASSWGLQETNPILAQHGQFDTKSFVIKSGIIGAVVLGEIEYVKHAPEIEHAFTYTNLAASGVFIGVAIHNLKLR